MEWNSICRVCIQEGEGRAMEPLFTDHGTETALSLKYNQCSPIEIVSDNNMPLNICHLCVQDLEAAYRFRTNCESSDAILKSFVVTIGANPTEIKVKSSDSAEVYKFQPPSGLKVRRFKVAPTVVQTDDLCMDFEYVNTDGDNDTAEQQQSRETDEDEAEIEEILFVKEEHEHDRDEQEERNEMVYFTYTESDVEDKDITFSEPVSREWSQTHTDVLDNVLLIDGNDQIQQEVQPEVIIKAVKGNKARLEGRAKKMSAHLEVESELANSALIGEECNTFRVKRIFNDPKPMKVCDICGNQYKYQHALESHLRRHRNDKPFACSICGKGFVINFELNRHMRSHTGQKPYACKFCDRKFSDFGSRIKHERTHTGERPYSCETCGKSFAYSHVLASHTLTHTGVKKYHCTICGKRFAKSHHLKAHLNTHDRNMLVRMTQSSNSKLMTGGEDYDDVLSILPDEDVSQQETISDVLQRQYVIAKLNTDEKDSVHLIEFCPSDLVDD